MMRSALSCPNFSMMIFLIENPQNTEGCILRVWVITYFSTSTVKLNLLPAEPVVGVYN
jgi:hypothetical protein